MYRGGENWMVGIIVVASILICYGLSIYTPDYYHVTQIGYGKMFMFVIGLFFGYMSKHVKQINYKAVIIILITVIALFFIQKKISFFKIIYKDSIPLIGIPILVSFFTFCEKSNFLIKMFVFFRWLGNLSLELYILHVMFKVTLYYACFELYDFDADIQTRRILIFVSLALSFILCSPIHKAIDKLLLMLK